MYIKIFVYLANKINYKLFYRYEKVFIIINVLPHIVLFSVLFIDTFYFHKIEFFYKAIWITILFFIIPLVLYSFNYVCEQYINYWENNTKNVWTTYVRGVLPPEQDFWHSDYDDSEDDECIPPDDMEISYRIFIPIYFNELYFEQETPHFYYNIRPTMEWYNNLFKEYNVTQDNCKEIKNKLITKDLDLIFQLKAIQQTYDVIMICLNVLYIVKNIKIIIYIGYLICWSYILYTSLYTFKDFDLLYNIIEVIRLNIMQSKIPFKICIIILIIAKYASKK